MSNENKQSNNTSTIKLVESNIGGTAFGEAPPPRMAVKGSYVGDSQNFTPKMTQSAKTITPQPNTTTKPQGFIQTAINNIVKKSK